jgi:hypothetical protein
VRRYTSCFFQSQTPQGLKGKTTMLKKISVLIVSASFLLTACAANKPKDASVDAAAAKAAADARPGSAGPGDAAAPVQVGPDIIVAVPADLVWKTLSDIENWGSWNSKVTEVQPGAGLNTGSELTWKWEEKEIHSTVTELKDNESLVLKGCRTGADVSLKWLLRPADDQHTVVSLRAILRSGAGSTLIANASVETQAWIMALQAEMNKKAADMPAPTPLKAAKKHKRGPTPVPTPAEE